MRIVVDDKEIDVNLEHYDEWKDAWLKTCGMTTDSPRYTHAVAKQIDREYATAVERMGKEYYQVVCEKYSEKYR